MKASYYKILFHMESNKILQADILDILFEDRNKEYGAYELRKTYNRRLLKAIGVTGSVFLLLFVGGMVSGRGARNSMVAPPPVQDVVLEAAKTEDPLPPPPPPPKVEVPRVATIQWTKPVVVPDNEKPDPPPTVDQLDDNVKISAKTADGTGDADVIAPPSSDAIGKGIVEAPKKDPEPEIWTKVEIESSYPGGGPAWLRFLNKNLHYPDDAQNNEIQGVVVVQFIVDDKGNVSDVQAISGPDKGGLREEAVRAIRKSGLWTPAIQNGRQVKSYKRQPITFKMPE